ncbi:MAG: hypothetical protein JWO10_2162 [Microbacteriaceae bacterium]|nr:hypothetical protein [Microbacteriaceae bacterium]
MKKFFAALSVATLAVGLAVVAVASPASAHTPTVTPSCTSLTVKLVSYEATGSATPNKVTVTIDNNQVENANYGTTFPQKSYPFTPSSTAHQWKVVVDAVGTDYDRTWTGTTTPCVVAAAPVFAPAACTGPGTAIAGGYTITATTGAKYQSKIDSSGWSDIGPGNHPVAAGKTIAVKALPVNSTLNGTTSWSYVVPSAGACTVKTAPSTPKVVAASGCNVPGSITLGTEAGVVYTFLTGSAAQTSGAYEVKATPAANYYFTGDQSVTYSGTLGTFATCATPKAASATDQSCTTQGTDGLDPLSPAAGDSGSVKTDSAVTSTVVSGSIEVFAVAGVKYTIHRVDGTVPDVVVASGVTDVTPGDYLVTAVAMPGYGLTGPTSWPMTVKSALLCVQLPDHALVSGSATATAQQCTGGSMQSGTIGVELDPALAYSVGSTKLTSAQTAFAPGTYTVTAAVTDPEFTFDGTPSWTVTVAAASAACGDLLTLAFTGGGAGLTYLSMAALLLMAGGAVVLYSRRVKRAA